MLMRALCGVKPRSSTAPPSQQLDRINVSQLLESTQVIHAQTCHCGEAWNALAAGWGRYSLNGLASLNAVTSCMAVATLMCLSSMALAIPIALVYSSLSAHGGVCQT
eukprot:GHUV01052947.1.p1 GENE.GHUV01052947.1~~GHUV01052947.1.p1  ORF type:complete len:107 (-),score=5.91 GHUV01052947.1:205-525(-)